MLLTATFSGAAWPGPSTATLNTFHGLKRSNIQACAKSRGRWGSNDSRKSPAAAKLPDMRAEAISWDDWSVSNPPPIVEDDKWHVEFEPNEVKIVSLEQLDDLFRLSIVDSETKVWQAGMAEWQPLRVIAGLGRRTACASSEPNATDAAPAASQANAIDATPATHARRGAFRASRAASPWRLRCVPRLPPARAGVHCTCFVLPRANPGCVVRLSAVRVIRRAARVRIDDACSEQRAPVGGQPRAPRHSWRWRFRPFLGGDGATRWRLRHRVPE